jgi:hypothetical protein
VHYAYLDESGTVTPFLAADRFLVVGVVAADQAAVRALELHVKRLKKKLSKKAMQTSGGELKARLATPEQLEKLLRAVADEDVAIVTAVVDKRMVYREPDDPEDWYRGAVALVARHCAARWPHLKIILDKRYTNQDLRDRLDEAIENKVGCLRDSDVSIEHADSKATPCLQVADYIAWVIRRKYEEGETQYYDLVKGRIICEEIIEAK